MAESPEPYGIHWHMVHGLFLNYYLFDDKILEVNVELNLMITNRNG